MEVYGNYYQIIRGKMTDTHHYYRMQLVKALLLAMFYDMSNVIYRVGEKEPKKIRRSDAIFTEFIRLLEKHYRTQRRVYWYAQKTLGQVFQEKRGDVTFGIPKGLVLLFF